MEKQGESGKGEAGGVGSGGAGLAQQGALMVGCWDNNSLRQTTGVQRDVVINPQIEIFLLLVMHVAFPGKTSETDFAGLLLPQFHWNSVAPRSLSCQQTQRHTSVGASPHVEPLRIVL